MKNVIRKIAGLFCLERQIFSYAIPFQSRSRQTLPANFQVVSENGAMNPQRVSQSRANE